MRLHHGVMSALAVAVLTWSCLLMPDGVFAQPELKLFLAKDSSSYAKMNFTNQVWMRFAQNNPGSAVGGTASYQRQDETFDLGLRRTRFQLSVKLGNRFFIYSQLGQNNFNYISSRKSGFFIHDALGEIAISKHLEMGAGLAAWTGFSRYSSPGVASIMALDAPLFLQATNDANDQFLRKLSVYAKGKLGKLDYRLIASKPMDFVYSTLYNKKSNIGADALFAPTPPHMQFSSYLAYNFLDQESNQTPYQVGTYLGNKRVLNLGAGIEFQSKATWNTVTNSSQEVDTLFHDMLLASVDLYYDAPLNRDKGNALSFYAVLSHSDFGKNYIRNLGVMNSTDSIVTAQSSFNGTGVAFPMIGTGNTAYLQIGYLSGALSSTKSLGKIMPYAAVQCSQYQKLNDPMIFIDAGCSWYLDAVRSKLTLAWQNRPVYQSRLDDNGLSRLNVSERKSAFILQYQVSI